MFGFLLAALGIALAAWHTRARAGRASLHPGFLKSTVGSLLTYALAALITAAGAVTAAGAMRSGGQYVLITIAVMFIAAALAGSSRNSLIRELGQAFEGYRREYPDLDDEALYRFVVHDRHPEWDNREIQDLTEDCYSLEELARRLEEKESSR